MKYDYRKMDLYYTQLLKLGKKGRKIRDYKDKHISSYLTPEGILKMEITEFNNLKKDILAYRIKVKKFRKLIIVTSRKLQMELSKDKPTLWEGMITDIKYLTVGMLSGLSI